MGPRISDDMTEFIYDQDKVRYPALQSLCSILTESAFLPVPRHRDQTLIYDLP